MGRLRWYYNRIKSYIGRPRLLVQERPVVLDDADRCEEPIFIIGVHRSGTSLVRRMFNSHPEIACPPETFFMKGYVDLLDDHLSQVGYESFGYDIDAMRTDLAHKASSLHEAYRISQGKTMWADKTPQYTFMIDGLDRLFGRKAKFFLVVRHPADVVYSNFKRGWTFNEIEDLFESTVKHVRDGIDHILAFEAAHPERCARIDYRLLCLNPAATLEAAMVKVGLAFHPDMLAFGDKSHNYGLEDPVVRGKRTVEASAGSWRSLSPRRIDLLERSFGPAVRNEVYW